MNTFFSKIKNKKIISIGILLIVIFILIAAAVSQKDKNYSAVFLDNNQVYFGLLDNDSRQFSVLKNVFYLQSGLQSGTSTQGFQLVKLGNELHGPEDFIKLNRDHILFIEVLREDSQIYKVIREYKAK
jgi:hypothetical protein